MTSPALAIPHDLKKKIQKAKERQRLAQLVENKRKQEEDDAQTPQPDRDVSAMSLSNKKNMLSSQQPFHKPNLKLAPNR